MLESYKKIEKFSKSNSYIVSTFQNLRVAENICLKPNTEKKVRYGKF